MDQLVRLMAGSGSYLGVGVRDIDAERKQALGLSEERGAEITSVEADSPAARAGLQTGDVVLEYASNRVESMEQFIRLVRETPSGREVKIVVSRAGAMTTLTAKVESGQIRIQRNLKMAQDIQRSVENDIRRKMENMDTPRAAMYWKSVQLGIEAEALDNQLADFFGVKQGVLVRSVSKGSAAETAGVKAGDVITAVEETRVSSPREVTTAIRSARANSRIVTLTLVRDKRESSLKVNFEDQETNPRPAPRTRTRTIQNRFQ